MSLKLPNPAPPANPPWSPPTPVVPNMSYAWRRCGSDRTWYASLISLNCSAASGVVLTSGCQRCARRRKAFFNSSSVALRVTPRIS